MQTAEGKTFKNDLNVSTSLSKSVVFTNVIGFNLVLQYVETM